MKNLVTLARHAKHASCLHTYELVLEDTGHHAHEGVGGSKPTAEGHQRSDKGKGRGKRKFDKGRKDGEDDMVRGKLRGKGE